MPIDPDAPTRITAFDNVPPFARGHVRDLRVRWALEEIGRPYDVDLLAAFRPRSADDLQRQPFGQVPAFADGQVRLFESGAILLYLGEQDERLLPREVQERWTAVAWALAALNSIEPLIMTMVLVEVFHGDKPWSAAAATDLEPLLQQRLGRLADALGDKDWLAGRFSVADILMVTVLRALTRGERLAPYPALLAYRQRGEDRPAFQRALAAQLDDFRSPSAQGETP